jgi:hypothetical protein
LSVDWFYQAIIGTRLFAESNIFALPFTVGKIKGIWNYSEEWRTP